MLLQLYMILISEGSNSTRLTRGRYGERLYTTYGENVANVIDFRSCVLRLRTRTARDTERVPVSLLSTAAVMVY